MRDRRFVAEHRGGPMKKEQHRQLIRWACDCAEHVLPLFHGETDDPLKNAFNVAQKWITGNATVGEARKAALKAFAVAKESSDQTSAYVARAAGHAVATAHMADHSLGAANYALKAVKNSGGSIEMEMDWQENQLPSEIKTLVLSARNEIKGLIKRHVPEDYGIGQAGLSVI